MGFVNASKIGYLAPSQLGDGISLLVVKSIFTRSAEKDLMENCEIFIRVQSLAIFRFGMFFS